MINKMINNKQCGKTQRHKGTKLETNVHAWYYPYHLTSVVWKLKNVRQKLQIEKYVMTAFSIQPIRTYGQKTIFSHVQVAVAKI